MSKRNRAKQNHKKENRQHVKNVRVNVYKTGQEPIKKEIDKKGNLVLTVEDNAKIDKVKQAQELARQEKVKEKAQKIKTLEAQRKAKEAVEELDNGGSGAIKAYKKSLEAKISEKEKIVEELVEVHKTELEELNTLYAELRQFTGIDNAVKSKGKGKKSNGSANGRFTATVKQNGDSINVLVKHVESKALFETSLYPKNGHVKEGDWIALRHRFTAFFEEDKRKNKADQNIPFKAYNLTLRAFLSNLKGKIEDVKPIV